MAKWLHALIGGLLLASLIGPGQLVLANVVKQSTASFVLVANNPSPQPPIEQPPRPTPIHKPHAPKEPLPKTSEGTDGPLIWLGVFILLWIALVACLKTKKGSK